MKLINKISQYFFISSILVFIIITGGLYFLIEFTIARETDEQLINLSKIASKELQRNNIASFPPYVEISKISANEFHESSFSDVLIDTNDEEDEPFRELISYTTVKGDKYKIVSRISLLENEDLFYSILAVSITAIFMFLLILYILNKTISQSILHDFYNTINKLDKFSVLNDVEFNVSNSDIIEFDQLNKSIELLTSKAKKDYRNLKEFSEELNHEIQTPIAVVKSKLENIIQSKNLSKEILDGLEVASRNLYKLERLNKSILLLNKLEHNDIFEISDVNLSKEIRNVIEINNDFLVVKNISLKLKLEDDVFFKANYSLINILLNNLLSNAIKHNISDGLINVELNKSMLKISNTGLKPKADTKKYFARFFKESNSGESIGLGLTIVNKICEQNNIDIKYTFEDNLHQLSLSF